MTTVAFDGRYLAADTQMTFGNGSINQLPSRKLVVRDGHVFASTGRIINGLRDRFVDWWFTPAITGADRVTLPDLGAADAATAGSLIIVLPDLRCGCVSYTGPDFLETGPISAWGSGEDYAVGAIEAGANAMEAVLIAMKHDINTGGEVEFVDTLDLEAGVQSYTQPADVRVIHGSHSPVMASIRAAKLGADIPNPILERLLCTCREAEDAPITLDVGAMLADLGLTERDAPMISRLYLPPATIDKPVPGHVYEFQEVRTGPWGTREEAAADLRRKLHEALRWPVRDTHKAIVHWRTRPEVWGEYHHDRMVTEWKGYARFVVLPAEDAPPTLPDHVLISKPHAPKQSDTGANLWADACTGRLVLGNGCGQCLRCNREWWALIKQSHEAVAPGVIRLTQDEVKASLARAPVVQPERFGLAKAFDEFWNDEERAKLKNGEVVVSHDAAEPPRHVFKQHIGLGLLDGRAGMVLTEAGSALQAHVDAWNTASAVGDEHRMKGLDIELRSLNFPPDVQVAIVGSAGSPKRKVIMNAPAQSQA